MIVIIASIAHQQDRQNQNDENQSVGITQFRQAITHILLSSQSKITSFYEKEKKVFQTRLHWKNVNIITVDNVKFLTLLTFSTDFSTTFYCLSANAF